MILTRRLLLGSTFASIMPLPAWAATDSPRIITARKATCQILPKPAAETAVFGFDGQVPGPLLRCKKGETLKIRLVNQLDQPLTFACLGMRLDNTMDGVAGLTQQPIAPGQFFDYQITPPDAGFFAYRSVVAPNIAEQLRHGLCGPFIVDETDLPVIDRELLVLLADWPLDANAQIAGDSGTASDAKSGVANSAGATSRPRTVTTVNSKLVLDTETLQSGARVRLRLLNAVSARIMFIAFDGINPLVVAIDGEPCDAFEPLHHMIPIGPGARFDLMFDLPAAVGAEARLILRSADQADETLLAFKTEGERRKDLPLITGLPPNPLLPTEIKLQASRKIDLVVDVNPQIAGGADPNPAFSLDGAAAKIFAPTPLFSVARGTPVTLGLVNKTAFTQQIHVHGHHLRLLHDLDDGWEPYWRDSVIIPARWTKHMAFIADNLGKWAIECLPLGPPSGEMVTWFEVT
jgi:FtsP/CotA-like multicopper oxidase with cupredoxin domain